MSDVQPGAGVEVLVQPLGWKRGVVFSVHHLAHAVTVRLLDGGFVTVHRDDFGIMWRRASPMRPYTPSRRLS